MGRVNGDQRRALVSNQCMQPAGDCAAASEAPDGPISLKVRFGGPGLVLRGSPAASTRHQLPHEGESNAMHGLLWSKRRLDVHLTGSVTLCIGFALRLIWRRLGVCRLGCGALALAGVGGWRAAAGFFVAVPDRGRGDRPQRRRRSLTWHIARASSDCTVTDYRAKIISAVLGCLGQVRAAIAGRASLWPGCPRQAPQVIDRGGRLAAWSTEARLCPACRASLDFTLPEGEVDSRHAANHPHNPPGSSCEKPGHRGLHRLARDCS